MSPYVVNVSPVFVAFFVKRKKARKLDNSGIDAMLAFLTVIFV